MKKYVLFAIIFAVTIALVAIPANAQLYAQFGRTGGFQVTVGVGNGYYGNIYYNYGYPGGYGNGVAYAQCINRGVWVCQSYQGYPYFGDSVFYQSRWISRMYMLQMQMMQMQYGYGNGYSYGNNGYGYDRSYSGRDRNYRDHRRRH